MLPRWHIVYGAIFIAFLLFFIPQTPVIYLVLVFFASFLIDFDHYAVAVFRTKKTGLRNALDYHKHKRLEEISDVLRGIKRKGDFHLFHTVEFHAFIGLLSLLWVGFFYIFIGMIFHSMLDVFSLLFSGFFHRREYFLFRWAKNKRL